MAYDTPLIELLRRDLDDPIRQRYNSNAEGKRISEITIDGNVIRGYGAFSFIKERTFKKTPERSGDGSMPDIEEIATFLTPHLKIDFSLLFIDDYRTLMNLVRNRNQHLVKCYDVVEDKIVENYMYLATEQMPKLATITRELYGQRDAIIELIGIQDYTIELIGTNNQVLKSQITYNLSVPNDISWSYDTTAKVETTRNYPFVMGEGATIDINGVSTKMSDITFDGNYEFVAWEYVYNNGRRVTYIDGVVYRNVENMQLYAKWERVI